MKQNDQLRNLGMTGKILRKQKKNILLSRCPNWRVCIFHLSVSLLISNEAKNIIFVASIRLIYYAIQLPWIVTKSAQIGRIFSSRNIFVMTGFKQNPAFYKKNNGFSCYTQILELIRLICLVLHFLLCFNRERLFE